MNGQTIAGEEQLRHMLHDCSPGRTIVLIISRDGQRMTVTTQMAVSQEEVEREAWERHINVPEPQDAFDVPESSAPSSSAPSAPRCASATASSAPSCRAPPTPGRCWKRCPRSCRLLRRGRRTRAAGVERKPNSPAALAGMQAGDVVVRANQKAIVSTSDWAKGRQEQPWPDARGDCAARQKRADPDPDAGGAQTLRTCVPCAVTDIPRRTRTAPVVVARIGFSWLPRS